MVLHFITAIAECIFRHNGCYSEQYKLKSQVPLFLSE